MNHGTTASLICPACGQAFLSMQHAMESMTQCPHCAHTAPRAHFGTQSQVAGIAQVLRRVAQSPQPQDAQTPAPPWQPQLPAHQPQPHLPSPPPFPPQPLFHSQPQAWQQPAAPPEPAPPPQIARGTLQYSQALLPVHAPPPPMDYAESQRAGTFPWRGWLFLLLFMGVCGASGWLWWNHAHPPPTPPASAPAARPDSAKAAAQEATEVRKAVAVPQPAPPPAKLSLEESQAIAADAKTLVTEFFAAMTAQDRATCVHDGAQHSAEIEALFGPEAPNKIELRQLAQLPTVVHTLPGGLPTPLFKLTTSRCANGALLRLETGEDGKRRIFWPLLVETHQDALALYLKSDTADPAWFHMAMRPSHGLDLPADLRARYITFNVQTSATSEPHFLACIERDTPLARFLDRESDWGHVYLCRLLVRKLEIEADSPCMIVVDCEGARGR